MQNTLQIVNRAKTFGEARRILKPGGLLFVGLYRGLARVLKMFHEGYAKGGTAHPAAKAAISALKQGPSFDGYNTWASEEHLGAVLDRFGFKLSADRPVERMMGAKPAATELFQAELRDPMALGHRLECEPTFAASFARHPEVADAFPMAVSFSAVKV